MLIVQIVSTWANQGLGIESLVILADSIHVLQMVQSHHILVNLGVVSSQFSDLVRQDMRRTILLLEQADRGILIVLHQLHMLIVRRNASVVGDLTRSQ